uniref:Splicing factor 45 n=1 Tax=Ditylenchus dipsaci TaxID=166011 RepID=A0A915D5E8_9BILA
MSLYDDIEVPVDAREKAQQSSSIATEAAKKADLQAKPRKRCKTHRKIQMCRRPQWIWSVRKSAKASAKVFAEFETTQGYSTGAYRQYQFIQHCSQSVDRRQGLKVGASFLFGEFNVEDEYNPTAPTDYASFKTKREAQRVKEKIAKEIADRILKQHEEEESKRKSGACFAPPQNLIEQDMAPPPTPSPPVVYESPSQFGKKRIWTGRDEQGMSTALRVEKTGKTGLIIAETATQQIEDNDDDVMEVGAGFSVSTEKTVVSGANITDLLKNSSKIVLLKNMVVPSEVDSGLEGEIKEEMKKYGQLNNVILHSMPNASVEEAIRIFLEFTNVNHAIKAVVDLNGRFFGGRAIHPEFYSLDNYMNRKLVKMNKASVLYLVYLFSHLLVILI